MIEPSALVDYSFAMGKRVLEQRPSKLLKEQGQFLTPPAVARFMAKQLGQIHHGSTLLEPAAGSGVLVCAVLELLIAQAAPSELWVDLYETDNELCEVTQQVLGEAGDTAQENGIEFHWEVFPEDFILASSPEIQPSLFSPSKSRRTRYDFILSNPPYLKLNSEDPRVKAVSGKVKGHTNTYTVFMALGAHLLSDRGRACFLVPRSFCSGVYFSKFRRELLHTVTPCAVHLFESRNQVFKSDGVLQENVVFTFEKKLARRKTSPYHTGVVNISTSKDSSNPENGHIQRSVSLEHFLDRRTKHVFFRLPTGVLDEQILDAVDRWDGSFERFQFQVSTGPVVAFRARGYLKTEISENSGFVPLLWMQHVQPLKVGWPLKSFKKPQALSTEDPSLLVPNNNYVLLRRFSAKEDHRRLIAAPFLSADFPHAQVGLENHLNYIYKKNGTLLPEEALGLSALLNSALVDRYFRIVNGNTQVNAAEIRALPLPPLEVIIQIGKKIHAAHASTTESVDTLVFDILRDARLIQEDIPLIRETRIHMGKIEQVQQILEQLGLPSPQQNEISALAFLVLAQLSDDTPWEKAETPGLRVHDILLEIKTRYGREYAENTRETIRRQVLHQFEQAGVAIRNPDDPALATNSPKTHYALSEPVLAAIRTYGTPNWESKRSNFQALRQRYRLGN